MVKYSGGKEFVVPRSGLFAPTVDTGYDVESVKLGKGRKEQQIRGVRNAELHDGSEWVKFYSDEISLSSSLAGSTAQSRYVRDFYAHNLKIPSVIVKGESLDQEEYATIIEFIHQSQIRGVQGGPGQLGRPVKLRISGGGSNLGPSMKGQHKSFEALGYVNSVQRKHERFVPAPQFDFEFVIAKMEEGIFKDVLGVDKAGKTWLEIIEGLIEHKVEPTAVQVAGERSIEEAGEVGQTVLEALKGLL